MAATGFCDLPTEALDDIARRVGPLDNVACPAVCRSWRRALKTTRLRVLERPKLPHHVYVDPRCECPTWRPTMLPCDSRGREPWTKKVCLCARESDHPVGVALDSKTDSVHPTRIIGSSYGWVVTIDKACSLTLLEPLTGRQFPLPPVTSSVGRSEQVIKNVNQMGQSMFHKAALAPGRRLGTYAVMLIHSGGYGLSFLAPGAQCWTALHAPACASRRNYQDVVFHKGAFYTVSVDSELNAWVPDGSSAGLRARIVASPQTMPVWAVLVESTTRDELLMVSTPKDDGGGPSSWSRLDVSRYDEHEGRWIPYVNHGDMEILVKDNVSLCVPWRGEPPMSTSSWFYSVDYDSSDSTSYGPYDCSLWRYGSWFLPYVAPEFYHY